MVISDFTTKLYYTLKGAPKVVYLVIRSQNVSHIMDLDPECSKFD